MASAWQLIGEKKLQRTLKRMRTTASYRVVQAGGKKAVQLAAKAIRKAVPSRFKSARKGVGWSAKRKRGSNTAGTFIAKAGVAVGKKKAALRALGETRASRRARGKGGVGIGPNSFHWWVTGTPHRRKHGKMRAQLPNFASDAVRPALGQMRAAQLAGSKAQLLKEVAKGKAF